MVGQVDNTDLAEDHLHVGEVLPSGEMDPRHAFHLLRSVCSRQLASSSSAHTVRLLCSSASQQLESRRIWAASTFYRCAKEASTMVVEVVTLVWSEKS